MYRKAETKYFFYVDSKDELIMELEAEINHLRNVVSNQAEIIAELQCHIDPYSPDGDAMCNSFYLDKYYIND